MSHKLGKTSEKIDSQTLLYLLNRFEKDNQLKSASLLIEIAREFFPGDPRIACAAKCKGQA